MSEQKNAEPVRKLYSSFLEGDIEGAIDQFSEDAVLQFHFPDGALPHPNRYEGHRGLREFFDVIDKYYEVEAFENREYIVQDDLVVAICWERTKVKSTGKVIELDIVHIHEVRDGKIVKMRGFEDTYTVANAHKS